MAATAAVLARATSPKPREAVKVTITPKPGFPPVVYPESAYVSLSRDQEINWECSGEVKECRVVFKGASPFEERVFGGRSIHSGRPRPEVHPDYSIRYRYSVTVDGDTIDPEVIVGQ